MRWIAPLLGFLCLVVATPAAAQTGRQLEFEVGAGQLGEDWLLSARLGFLYFDEVGGIGCAGPEYGEPMEDCTTPVGVALQIPARFELYEAEPSEPDILRTEDWDEPGDFFRFVRFVEYGRPHEPLHARFGELGAVVIGHGTIVNGYHNTVTAGDFHPGFEAAANTTYGGLHLMLDDVSRPRVFGGRAYVRPWGFDDRTKWWHRLAIGISAVSDIAAPTELDRCEPGETCSGDTYFGSEPSVADAEPVAVVGLDVELTVVDTDVFEFLPYVDLNASLGVGAHAGTVLRLALGEHWATSLRLEGRLLGPRYLPGYFGPLYAIDRFRMGGWNTQVAAPQARVAASQDEPAYGGFGQLAISWREWASLTVAASDHSGSNDASARVRLTVTPPGPFTMGVYWARQNTSPDRFLDLDGALLATEARLSVWGPIYLHGRYDRLWQLNADGRYEPTTEWNAGVGAAFALGGAN